jgi:NAD+ kinase
VSYQRIGLLYHPREAAALALAQSLLARLDTAAWLAETGDDATAAREMAGTDLLVCVGGDGTTLWAARLAGPYQCHLVSVNMGRLGFLSALSPQDAAEGLARILAGEGVIEQRAMVECLPLAAGGRADVGLNDVVVGRAAPGRPVYISVEVDGEHLATVRADAMIVATATGSTAYNLSAGGPILTPTAQNLLITPVAPHLSRMRPFILPPEAVIDLTVQSDFNAVISVDGQVVRELRSGETIRCRRATQTARFLVLGGAGEFFHRLALHLNLTSRGENPVL